MGKMAVNARQAKTVASRWVNQTGARLPGFRGAYFAGSVASLSEGDVSPPWTDVDIMVVIDDDLPVKIGKMSDDGVLLDVTFLPQELLRSPGAILGHYHLAHSFANAAIIADRYGELTPLQTVVAREFAKRRWVDVRRLDARIKVEVGLASLPAEAPFHEQVLSWVFPTGVLTHILLVAGLRNPTVRRRYEETVHMLTAYQLDDIYESLLEVLGCDRMTRDQVERHLAAVSEAFDAAAKIVDAPFPFASDISELARPIAIDGSREMIVRGLHREAVFWIVVTWSRSLKILDHAGALPANSPSRDGYRRLLGDLGLASHADLKRRSEQVLTLLPEVWNVADEIIRANPEIIRD